MSDSTHDKWRQYPNTILEFLPESAAPLKIDLRDPLDDRALTALRALELPQPFAIFTAENPEGRNAEDAPTDTAADRGEEQNERRTAVLERALDDAKLPWLPVDGLAPDGGYREHCVAVSIPRSEAAALAARLRQLALFWFDGDRFWLLPATADERPEPLPR